MAFTAGALAIAASASVLTIGQGKATSKVQIAADSSGNIHLPKIDFRKDWVALGTWAAAAEEGAQGSQGLHVVYAQPETVEAYRKTGTFPDGAVLVKELLSTKTEDMTTGTISRAHAATGWFVMIKDAIGRYPGNKLWGDGWGWAHFDAKLPSKVTTTDYEADCKGCHVPAQSTDWVYVQGYPVLQKK
ncbi:MAG: cytochrome P460 family protein [Alphaproteobacteria bacterium]|nr:cytochrome P460 family protein [Alphaproteobacteria bacterium]